MIVSLEHSLLITGATVLLSIGGAWATLKGTTKKVEEAHNKANAIGSKIDSMKNEFIELKTAIDKDIESLKREIEHFNENSVTRKDIENFVTKDHCNNRFKDVVQKSELELILEKIDLRFTHVESDMKEVKQDIKAILSILRGGKDD
ncbi:hypothetical protein JCM11957_06810 [Caminibacter profundus]